MYKKKVSSALSAAGSYVSDIHLSCDSEANS